MKTETENYTLEQFTESVDQDCWQAMGMSLHDLPDFPIIDYYDGGIKSGKEFDYAVKMCVFDIQADNGLEPYDY
ncbi:hypothetical protein CMI37_24715 [Candidatus Pacearchaeota archaeon]|nr:hypothetical protein [Candidatus Pacearchaeota archaeon]|tara:strand:+ start:237 stop:458 length:222 start_codon:yes stop_codon:yes gene_type:complete